MAAYIIFVRDRTLDPVELKTYASKVGASIPGHSLKTLALYGHQQVLEGPEVEGVVILEFPTFDEAKAWYNSPAYTEAREHRFRGAEYRVVLVQGV